MTSGYEGSFRMEPPLPQDRLIDPLNIKPNFDELKATYSKGSCMVWIICGVYLFASLDTAHFFSWQALVYFTVGLFACSLTFGVAGYLLMRGMAKVLIRIVPPYSSAEGIVPLIGFVIMGGGAVAIYFAARWLILRMTHA
jgi:hypothetical protein